MEYDTIFIILIILTYSPIWYIIYRYISPKCEHDFRNAERLVADEFSTRWEDCLMCAKCRAIKEHGEEEIETERFL